MYPQEFTELARRHFWHVKRLRNRAEPHRFVSGLLGPWLLLGSELYGQAWVHKDYPDLVLKISGPKGWGEGCQREINWVFEASGGICYDAWPVYAQHCYQNPHPNLPKLYHFERMTQGYTIGIMPRYRECSHLFNFDEATAELARAIHSGEADDMPWLWPIIQMVSALGYTVDLHDGNILYDKDNTPILTDPFSNHEAQAV